MEYRSYSDLSNTISENLNKIPPDVDLVVGIPRSGMLAGNLIALYLQLPLVDLDGYIQNNRLYPVSGRATRQGISFPSEANHVLMVDDTIYAGKSMAHARYLVEKASMDHKFTSCSVYANPKSLKRVDIYFEKLTSPGCQEWNIMHRDKLEHFCVSMDGVLCKNPTKQETLNSHAYVTYLETAKPIYLPSHKIGCLVTNRLEKYRTVTESWLSKYDIQYHQLHMLDQPKANNGVKLRTTSSYKAQIYIEQTDSPLFIENDEEEAHEISRISGKEVLCFSSQKLIKPTIPLYQIKRNIKTYRNRAYRKAKKIATQFIPQTP